MEPIEGSETSAFKPQTPGKYPKENILITTVNVQSMQKMKQSHYRAGQALSFPGGCGSKVSRQSAHEGGKVVSPTHRPLLPPQERFLVLISVRG